LAADVATEVATWWTPSPTHRHDPRPRRATWVFRRWRVHSSLGCRRPAPLALTAPGAATSGRSTLTNGTTFVIALAAFRRSKSGRGTGVPGVHLGSSPPWPVEPSSRAKSMAASVGRSTHRSRAVAPARLAAWSIGRTPPSGIWNRTGRGLETAPDTRPSSYLWLRNTVNSVVSRADNRILQQPAAPLHRRCGPWS
jgi:hypothetical protein